LVTKHEVLGVGRLIEPIPWGDEPQQPAKRYIEECAEHGGILSDRHASAQSDKNTS